MEQDADFFLPRILSRASSGGVCHFGVTRSSTFRPLSSIFSILLYFTFLNSVFCILRMVSGRCGLQPPPWEGGV